MAFAIPGMVAELLFASFHDLYTAAHNKHNRTSELSQDRGGGPLCSVEQQAELSEVQCTRRILCTTFRPGPGGLPISPACFACSGKCEFRVNRHLSALQL